MSYRLYEDVLPIELEYFISDTNNAVKALREAEEVSREKFVIDHMVKNVLNTLLKTVDKLSDNKPIDTSKGSISRMPGHKELLNSINDLSKKYYVDVEGNINSGNMANWGIENLIHLARKSYLYISNLDKEFTAGYKSNNLLIINYYRALVANLIALVGECIAYQNVDKPYLSLRVKSLHDFIVAYDSGSVKNYFKDSASLLESVGLTNNNMLFESYDIIQSSINLIKKLINNFDKDGTLGEIAYKAIDFVRQILNIKTMVWPLIVNNFLPKFNDYLLLFRNFIGGDDASSSSTSKIAEQIIDNASKADDRANYLIHVDNENLFKGVQKNWATNRQELASANDFSF